MQGIFDAAQMAVELEKNILRNFLGQTVVAGHTKGDGKDHRLVLVDELLEIGLPGSGHKLLLPTIPQGCASWDAESYENEGEKFRGALRESGAGRLGAAGLSPAEAG